MKIVKQIEDPVFLRKVYDWKEEDEWSEKDKWFWGLGEDGEVYYRCTPSTDNTIWIALTGSISIASKISFKDMRKLVKEFGHLVIFT